MEVAVFSIKVHSVGLGKISKTYEMTVPADTTLEALYGLIETNVNVTNTFGKG
jgi:hypothetical protein